jgi:8-oxo-dGTP pyrophosphatase MutT (NUDIX family)
VYWDLPGGRVQRGDTVEETLRREIEEETGSGEIIDVRPVGMVLSNIRIPLQEGGDVGLILSVYRCRIDNSQPILLGHEHTEAKWFSPTEAAELLKVKYPPEFTKIVERLEKYGNG